VLFVCVCGGGGGGWFFFPKDGDGGGALGEGKWQTGKGIFKLAEA